MRTGGCGGLQYQTGTVIVDCKIDSPEIYDKTVKIITERLKKKHGYDFGIINFNLLHEES
jgi:hypothetical protein